MSEMQLVADHLLVIGQGRILADASIQDFIEDSSTAARSSWSPPTPARWRRCSPATA